MFVHLGDGRYAFVPPSGGAATIAFVVDGHVAGLHSLAPTGPVPWPGSGLMHAAGPPSFAATSHGGTITMAAVLPVRQTAPEQPYHEQEHDTFGYVGSAHHMAVKPPPPPTVVALVEIPAFNVLQLVLGLVALSVLCWIIRCLARGWSRVRGPSLSAGA